MSQNPMSRGRGRLRRSSYPTEYTGASIALIEAGDMDRDPFIQIPAGFAKILAHDRHVWEYETVPQHRTKRAYRSGEVLGGDSSINTMCYVRRLIRDYAAWQDAAWDASKLSCEDLRRHRRPHREPGAAALSLVLPRVR